MAGYLFEWDAVKAEANRRKHGVTFDEAITAFSDPLAMLLSDPEHSIGEQRYIVLGTSTQRRLPVVAFAERPPRTRLISGRQATRMERRQYEEES
ncbi:MAG: BrnT family toxin [Acidobacteriota bacterium]